MSSNAIQAKSEPEQTNDKPNFGEIGDWNDEKQAIGGKRKSSSICSPREKKSKTYSRAAQDTEVVMALLKRVLDESPTSIRNEIAAQFDVEARLLHMSWANILKKKILKAAEAELSKGK